jgi:hypothetical protein
MKKIEMKKIEMKKIEMKKVGWLCLKEDPTKTKKYNVILTHNNVIINAQLDHCKVV